MAYFNSWEQHDISLKTSAKKYTANYLRRSIGGNLRKCTLSLVRKVFRMLWICCGALISIEQWRAESDNVKFRLSPPRFPTRKNQVTLMWYHTDRTSRFADVARNRISQYANEYVLEAAENRMCKADTNKVEVVSREILWAVVYRLE